VLVLDIEAFLFVVALLDVNWIEERVVQVLGQKSQFQKTDPWGSVP